VSDLMSFPVTTVSPTATLRETAMLLREKGYSGFPVAENEKLVGVISRRDFRKMRGEKQLELPVKAFMGTRIKTISPGKSPADAARMMVKHDIGRLPVVESGKIIGIMTRSDVMLYFYDLVPD
ncbi:MAG: CBS domain-containing protein, partial [Deltaproteobacteria bacterium]|nr:CBS domain-containing protein [Deltaproteobacteria bacterium]